MQPDKRIIPDSAYTEFYKIKDPGNSHMVWLGGRGIIDKDEAGGQMVAAAQVGPLREFGVRGNMSEKRRQEFRDGTFYVGTLAVGCVILQLVGHDLQRGFDIVRKPQGWLDRIWKPDGHILWPPALGVGSFEGLHESLKPPRK